jgi:hypothetical protein
MYRRRSSSDEGALNPAADDDLMVAVTGAEVNGDG